MSLALTLRQSLPQPRLAVLAAAAAAAALIAALIAQYGFDLLPCILCVYQRYAHGTALALALLAVPLAGPAGRLLLAGSGLAYLGGAGLGVFHVGVEQHWWQGFTGCTTPAFDPEAGIDALREALMATPVVRCDEIPWELFGISMAGYNVFYSLGLASLILWLTLSATPRHR
jgi:disulfide bond formation protein DsbB